MKKKDLPQKIDFSDRWRVWNSKKGPTGLELLAEILNWNSAQIDEFNFKEEDPRREVIRRLKNETICETARAQAGSWRNRLKSLQKELRADTMSILEPTQLSEEEFTFWRDSRDGTRLPGLSKDFTARFNRLWILLTKIKEFKWTESLAPSFLRPGRRKSFAWNLILGEHNIAKSMVTIKDETLEIVLSPPSFGNIREQLYYVLRTTLSTGEFSKFRICERQKCKRFFVAKRPTRQHCSDKCRERYNNEQRQDKGKFRDYYADTKANQIKRAQKLRREGKTTEEILDETKLTFNAWKNADAWLEKYRARQRTLEALKHDREEKTNETNF